MLRGTHTKLNTLNFFAADVGDGIGPFLATYLIATADWQESSIGWVLLVLNLSTVVAQTPAGWLIDHTRLKRILIALAAGAIAVSMLAIPLAPNMPLVLSTQVIIGSAAAIIPPAIAAITLGIVRRSGFTRQMGANQAFNHAGNVMVAVSIGAVSYLIWPGALFPVIMIASTMAAITVLSIPEHSIDHVAACGAADDNEGKTVGAESETADGIDKKPGTQDFRAVFSNRRLVIFMICVALFHLANAPMLPLAGQKLALGHKELATLFLSGCVIIAQLVMIGVAILVGLRADRWGRKVFLLVGFGVLPIRGILFALVDEPSLVLAIQILDGVGAGIYSVILFLVVADVTRGTGTFNLAQGLVITTQGIGAALGSLLGEQLAGAYGYQFAFAAQSALAVVAFLLLLVAMPETRPAQEAPLPDPSVPGGGNP